MGQSKHHTHFAVDRNAATALEFALVGPLFLLLLAVIMDSGGAALAQADLEARIERTARLVQTGQAREGSYTSQTFGSEFCSGSIVLGNCASSVELQVRNFNNFAAAATALANWSADDAETNFQSGVRIFEPGNSDEIAVVRATYVWEPWLASPLANSASGNRVMVATAIFRNE